MDRNLIPFNSKDIEFRELNSFGFDFYRRNNRINISCGIDGGIGSIDSIDGDVKTGYYSVHKYLQCGNTSYTSYKNHKPYEYILCNKEGKIIVRCTYDDSGKPIYRIEDGKPVNSIENGVDDLD
jgi:hypothetical protein